MRVYGITGLIGSGKDESTRVFERHGYQHISLSDCLRNELTKNKIPITRENLIDYANQLRKKNPSQLAEIAAKKVKSNLVVFSSIRNVAEVDFFRLKFAGFKMIKIESSEEMRFERLKKRGRENEPKTLAEFRAREKKDMTTGLSDVLKSTKMVIYNNETLEKLDKLVTNFIASDCRPGWDEYFLEIAEVVGRRADCCRGRIGTILVKDKKIIATGYNGSPRGTKHCSEVGCRLAHTKDEQGRVVENCVRTAHSDINAVIQAALHGVSTRGATLYGYYKPCYNCAKAIVQAGIVRVVVRKNYHEPLTDELFKEVGIKFEIVEPHEEGNA